MSNSGFRCGLVGQSWFYVTHRLFLSPLSWPQPGRAPAAVEGRDRRRRSRSGRQRHQTQRRRWWRRRRKHRLQRWRWWWRRRRPRPLHQQLFFNYLLLLQPRQSVAAHLPPFHRQRTVARPQPQKRAGKGTGTGAREVPSN